MTGIGDKVGQSREMEQFISSEKRLIGQGAEEVDQEARDIARDALAKLSSHETLCTERWNQQRQALENLVSTVSGLQRSLDRTIPKLPAAVIAGLTGLVGYLADRAFPIH